MIDIHSLSKYQAENIQNSKMDFIMDFIIDLAKCLINSVKPLIQDLIKTFRGSSSDFMGSDFIIFDLILVTIVMMVVVSGCLDHFIQNSLRWILRFFIWNLSERWQQEEPRRQIILGDRKGKFSWTLPNPKRKDLNSVDTKISMNIEEEVKEKPKKVEGKTSLPKSRSKSQIPIPNPTPKRKDLNSADAKTSMNIEEEVKKEPKKDEGKTSLPKSRSKDLNSILKALNSTKPKTSTTIEGGPSLKSKLHPKIKLQTQDPSKSADVV